LEFFGHDPELRSAYPPPPTTSSRIQISADQEEKLNINSIHLVKRIQESEMKYLKSVINYQIVEDLRKGMNLN
jgi:hypothetical protein